MKKNKQVSLNDIEEEIINSDDIINPDNEIDSDEIDIEIENDLESKIERTPLILKVDEVIDSTTKDEIRVLAKEIEDIAAMAYNDLINNLPNFEKLTKEIRNSCEIMKREEVRFLVYQYYVAQKNRTTARKQIDELKKKGKDPKVLIWLADFHTNTEKTLKKALDYFTKNHPVGIWIRSNVGLGPVTAAGLLAHIDITKVTSAAQIMSFAGLSPHIEWKAGTPRPYNQNLKNLCWNIGQCFIKNSNRENDYYGKIYKARKVYENSMNDALLYKEQAKLKLEKNKIGKTTEAYKHYSIGKLPPGHINARCSRYAVKLFLSHLFTIWYRYENGVNAPLPYILLVGGHTHYIEPPNQDKIFLK